MILTDSEKAELLTHIYAARGWVVAVQAEAERGHCLAVGAKLSHARELLTEAIEAMQGGPERKEGK